MIRRLILVLSMSLLGGCGASGAVGTACAADVDCAEARCELGGSFPGGLCTVACDGDADCPAGFSCISRSSGICMQNCANTAVCEAIRGPGWQCREESLEEGDGNRLVCNGD